MPNFSRTGSEMVILTHLPLKQVSEQARKKKLLETSMQNFSQIGSEITILAHFSNMTNQPTN